MWNFMGFFLCGKGCRLFSSAELYAILIDGYVCAAGKDAGD